MANQPKKYTKFVATAATATLVASAIVPVASAASFSDVAETNSHAENINALVEAGIIKGFEDGTFKPGQELTRGQVVKMLGKWVEAQGVTAPADFATKARFTDLAVDAKDQELVKYAALVADAKVFNGSNGVLNASGKISRENMALVLDRAYTAINETSLVALAADIEDVKVADLATAKKEAQEAIQALRDLGISSVEAFNPKASVTRGQFASFLNKTINTVVEVAPVELTLTSAVATSATTLDVVLSDESKHVVTLETALEANKETEVTFTIGEKEYTAKVTFVVAPLTVTNVAATSATTLVVVGETLAELKAADITVENNAVVSVVASEDGKSAVVTLGAALVPNTEYKVSVKDALATKDFTVKHALLVAGVTVDSVELDDDTANQYVTFKIDGKKADLTDLIVNGYTVEFKATKTVAGVTSPVTPELFADANTGLINTGLSAGTNYKVQVTVSKDSEVLVSEQATVAIKNFELVASSVDATELTLANGVVLASNTLVVTETASLTELVAIQNGNKTTLDTTAITNAIAANTLEIKSSNPAVVSVANNVLTANTPGKVAITVTYGNVTETIDLTVAQEARKIAKVTPKAATLTTVLSPVTNNEMSVTAIDQYGDALVGEAISVSTSNTAVANAAVTGATDAEGKDTVTVTPLAMGTTAVVFKDAAGKTVGSFAVKVTDNASTAKTALEIIKPTAAEIALGQSEDATIDKAVEENVKFQLQPYTAEGVKLAVADLAGYTVKFDKNIVEVNGDTTGELVVGSTTELDITAADLATVTTAKLGSTDIAVYDINNVLVGKVRVTTVNNTPELKTVAFKPLTSVNYVGKAISYKDLLTVTEVAKDDIVKGITLTSSVNSVIRIDETGANGLTAGTLYIDQDGDAVFSTGDIELGLVEMSVVSGSTGLAGFTDIIAGSTTALNDNGTIIVTVKNTEAKIVSSTSITVKVEK